MGLLRRWLLKLAGWHMWSAPDHPENGGFAGEAASDWGTETDDDTTADDDAADDHDDDYSVEFR